MQGIKLIAAGKLKERFYIEACAEYLKRIKPMAAIEVLEIAEEANRPDGLKREGEKILAAIPQKAFVCAMCIEGKMMDSPSLAKVFLEAQNRGFSNIAFIIGSSNGLDGAVKERADLRLSMSPMTFPHHLARVMALEQIYRALSINSGSKYHK